MRHHRISWFQGVLVVSVFILFFNMSMGAAFAPMSAWANEFKIVASDGTNDDRFGWWFCSQWWWYF